MLLEALPTTSAPKYGERSHFAQLVAQLFIPRLTEHITTLEEIPYLDV